MEFILLASVSISCILIADNARLRKEIKEKINFEYEQFKVNRKY